MKFLQKDFYSSLNLVRHLNGGGFKDVTAKVSDEVYLGPGTIVGNNAEIIGNNIYLGPGIVVGNKVKIYGQKINIKAMGIGSSIVIKNKAKILGTEIKITGAVEIGPNVEISGKDISIFGFKEGLFITKNFKERNICVYQKGKL